MEKKNNKVKQAIALEYDPNDIAPKVIATGSGHVAERILDEAKKENIPIHEDEKLAATLSKLDVGENIPPELYEVVAEILVFVDAMDKLKGKMKS
ncbi:MAG: EscU/YscU/HrcU family type III secretion system export apparatus switch protein [Lachnospiraceae bacterium]|nr:EscU/YscU/HrcU family type III secretion system export apparatus switch protein [Lachnospiraceae bacterium]MCR4934461.1 EscU/YscU/HrcU family type III secretion system export apparatus switch protein [Lachnospiraceae bacterium]